MRIVLDTNVLISALITQGTPPDELYQAWLRGEIEVVTSRAQLAELAAVLARPRLREYLDANEAEILVDNLDTRAVVLEELPDAELSADPKDNPILATAIAGQVDLLVSGDKRHVLSLSEAEGIAIVSAREALDQLGNE